MRESETLETGPPGVDPTSSVEEGVGVVFVRERLQEKKGNFFLLHYMLERDEPGFGRIIFR